ncbi:MAG: hypothetical protein RLZZ138_28 [Actinomycetota bacterium]|jgi:hypothetical protein
MNSDKVTLAQSEVDAVVKTSVFYFDLSATLDEEVQH